MPKRSDCPTPPANIARRTDELPTRRGLGNLADGLDAALLHVALKAAANGNGEMLRVLQQRTNEEGQ